MLSEPGSTLQGYDHGQRYTISDQVRGIVASLAHDYHLTRVREWPIAALRVHCLVFALPAGASRERIVARLSHDRRVALAQPLQLFATRAVAAPAYNDPYFGLQSGLSAIGAVAAQRWGHGAVRIAIIDTGVDVAHPDLAGRISVSADFVDGEGHMADRHGTAVAGIIGADANNGLGIVGIAPASRLQVYKACEPLQPQSLAASCNSFTLALALSAAIDAKAQIVNLSLGGPADPLLEQLVRVGQSRGQIFVGALPEDGTLTGFPIGISGVIAAGVSGHQQRAGVLSAPGRDVLTLSPGGHYDYASGSSFAAAHVTGAIALLLTRAPRTNAAQLRGALQSTQSMWRDGWTINVCAALASLTSTDRCSAVDVTSSIDER
jgi:subtilisin family serine protease